MPQIIMITIKCFILLGHFEIAEIEVFVDISVSHFNFPNISRKYIANLAAGRL